MAAVLPKVQQPGLAPFIKDELLTRQELEKITGALQRNKALNLAAGKVEGCSLYVASLSETSGAQTSTGKHNVWVRDNMFLAMAFHEMNEKEDVGTKEAVAIVSDVAKFFLKTAARFDDIIAGKADPRDPMCRPHVRFIGERLEESAEPWNHMQNDALGYFMWMRCRLCVEGKMPMTGGHLRLLGLMLEYLVKIEYWQDEDGGHWEEDALVRASSIGPVVAAAREFQKLLRIYPGMMVPCQDGTLDLVEQKGAEALQAILPHECVQEGKRRDVDSALLFLVHPLNIVDKETARTIVGNVTENLMGSVGIRRYNGDGYCCKDYRERFGGGCTKAFLTREEQAERRALVLPGEEAQSCIFDPVLSTIFGVWYRETRDLEDLLRQQQHLFRSLAQVTGSSCPSGPWLCPESYYLSKGSWVPSDVCPLFWSQANLSLALMHMDRSLQISSDEIKGEFTRFDVAGAGTVSLEDLVTVLTKVNPDLPAEEVAKLLAGFAMDGKVSFEKMIDQLFCGSLTEPVRASYNLRGLRPIKEMSPDEVCEVERVLTDVLLELHGDFAGEYFPMPSSTSFPARVGGMSAPEAHALESSGMFFSAPQSSGRGVFANDAFDVAVLVNNEAHMEIVIKPSLGETESAEARLQALERVLDDALRLSGHEMTR